MSHNNLVPQHRKSKFAMGSTMAANVFDSSRACCRTEIALFFCE